MLLWIIRRNVQKMFRANNGYEKPVHSSSPFPFGGIYFVVLVMRKGGENSGLWHLGCRPTLEVFHAHSYQDQFIIQPGWAECFFVYLA